MITKIEYCNDAFKTKEKIWCDEIRPFLFVLQSITRERIDETHIALCSVAEANGKKLPKGKQTAINKLIATNLDSTIWRAEIPVLEDEHTKLIVDYVGYNAALEVAFTNGSYLGIDLLKLSLATIQGIAKYGVYICPKASFRSYINPSDSIMTTSERAIEIAAALDKVMRCPLAIVSLE